MRWGRRHSQAQRGLTPCSSPTLHFAAASQPHASRPAPHVLPACPFPNSQQVAPSLLSLPREEIIRRLRKLGQPATLWGEEDIDRIKRLQKASQDMAVEDETRGGHQANTLLELRKAEKQKRLLPGHDSVALGEQQRRDKLQEPAKRARTPPAAKVRCAALLLHIPITQIMAAGQRARCCFAARALLPPCLPAPAA